MTRRQFIENITEWSELISFCYDEDCTICEYIYDENGMDVEINEYLRDYVDDYDWEQIRDYLSDIPIGVGYFRQNGAFSWEELDYGDFREYKRDVLYWMDDGGYWDDEEDVADLVTEVLANSREDNDELLVEEEDFEITELMDMCSATFSAACQTAPVRQNRQKEAELREFGLPW